MERDYERELRSFAAVWQRVQKGRAAKPDIKLMPRSGKSKGIRRKSAL